MDVSVIQASQPDMPKAVGHVIAVRGSRAEVGLAFAEPNRPLLVTVGSFLAVEAGRSCLIGVVTEVAHRNNGSTIEQTAAVDLVGEIRPDEEGIQAFTRGVSFYPTLNNAVDVLSPERMSLIYAPRNNRSITIGHMFHDRSVLAQIDVDSMLDRHFAILGSTGVGKSSGVAILLRETLAVHSTFLRVHSCLPRSHIVDNRRASCSC